MLSVTISLAAQEITGSWSGTLNVMGNRLPVVFNISRTDSLYSTTMDSPAQNAFGVPTTKTTFSGNRLEIVATGLGIFIREQCRETQL